MDGGPHSHPGAILFVPCDSVPCSEVSRWSYAALLSPEVSIQRRPAHAEVLGGVLGGVAILLHPLCGGDVLGRARQARVISKELGPAYARAARIMSAQVAKSDFLVSQREADFPRI